MVIRNLRVERIGAVPPETNAIPIVDRDSPLVLTILPEPVRDVGRNLILGASAGKRRHEHRAPAPSFPRGVRHPSPVGRKDWCGYLRELGSRDGLSLEFCHRPEIQLLIRDVHQLRAVWRDGDPVAAGARELRKRECESRDDRLDGRWSEAPPCDAGQRTGHNHSDHGPEMRVSTKAVTVRRMARL